IHEADLAVACVDAFGAPPGSERDIGGPDALSRREIAAHALRAVGREAKQLRVPVSVLRNTRRLLRPLNPRVGDLMTFIAAILVADFVAPPYGTRHIADYFAERAVEAGWRAESAD